MTFLLIWIFIFLRSEFEGGPVQHRIFQSWLMVEVPWNIGFPLTTYPIMHPKLQISIYFEYEWQPISNSGARYHLVAMQSVMTAIQWSSGSSKSLTRPKSQSLASHYQLTNTLEGFKSLWMMSELWRQQRALQIWQTIYFLCFYWRMFPLMRVCRSTSMCSKMRQMSISLVARRIFSSLIIFGCFNCFKNMISRQMRWASVELEKASKFFFRAFKHLVFRS